MKSTIRGAILIPFRGKSRRRLLALLLLLAAGKEIRAEMTPGKLYLFHPHSGWCWFEDERAVVDGPELIIGSVSCPGGNIDVTAYNIRKGGLRTMTLHEELETDDHDSPALLRRPDGRYLAVYSKHHGDNLMRWRISTEAGNPEQWQPEQTLPLNAPITYSNLFCLSGENNRIYNFHRGLGWDPNFMISDDLGATWRYGGRLLKNADDPENRMRPYLKYASDNRDTIHFVATEAHPAGDGGTSLYHGYLKGGIVYRSDGTPVQDLNDGPADPTALTRIFPGDEQNEAWPCDIHLDGGGQPFVVYSVHKSDEDHRYRYARWNGSRWLDTELAHAGTCLYPAERHYTGLAALDPHDPNTVYISTNAVPFSGEPLISRGDGKRHYQIFRCVTSDGGLQWTWTSLTPDPTEDHLRPIVPVWESPERIVLWLKGTYSAYTDYRLLVVGQLEKRNP